MSLNLQDVINKGILNALASVYNDPTNAQVLVASVGFPTGQLPVFTNPMPFWTQVCEQIDNGILRGGFESLLSAAARTYPGNPSFAPFSDSETPTSDNVGDSASMSSSREPSSNAPQTIPTQNTFVNLLVTGINEPQFLLETIRRLAEEQGLSPGSINMRFANTEGILISLMNWQTEQALEVAEELSNNAQREHHQTVQTSVADNDFEDYLIRRLLVEGPDQAKFEINNIRASTLVRDIAQGVIDTQYDSGVFEAGPGNQGREVVVDRVDPSDGSTQRLNPDRTLHEEGIQEDDSLSVSPESTAGMHPQIREEALVRGHNQIMAYAKSSRGFQVSANSHRAPTEYIFKFNVSGFAPPSSPSEQPVKIDQHEVFLILLPEFPMKAPQAYWQTPIFHPNVHPQFGAVCLGALGDRYRPGLDLGELCKLLVDIASYQNYALDGVYNSKARKWALSKAGQIAIEELGGKSFTRKLLHQVYEPRPLSIERV